MTFGSFIRRGVAAVNKTLPGVAVGVMLAGAGYPVSAQTMTATTGAVNGGLPGARDIFAVLANTPALARWYW